MEKKLYLVSTHKFESYVVASDYEEAKRLFEKWLNDNDYGLHVDRNVVSIKVVASEGVYPKDNITNYTDKLIING